MVYCQLMFSQLNIAVCYSRTKWSIPPPPLECINEMIIWKLNPFIRFNDGGIMHLFFKCSDRKSIFARLLPERLYRCHFWSEHLKNEFIIPPLLKRINGFNFQIIISLMYSRGVCFTSLVPLLDIRSGVYKFINQLSVR